jgi:tRNA dimethylallyltransferase
VRETKRTAPIYAISGPTASGKTEIAVKLALEVAGEVVNFDSVQIYREIEIATAKPSEEEKRGVPHHLIGYVDPRFDYTAADWARDAAVKIHEIEARGRTPVLVGGTGFYLRTLMRPLFESPTTDAGLRDRLRNIHERRGAEHLHLMLRRVDPGSADTLFPRDYPRVMRALEVYFQTGNKLSELQPNRAEPPEFASRIRLFVLNPPRDLLYEKIDRRTEAHFASGLVEEVKELLVQGVPERSNALGAHAYRRVCEFLRGERTFESAVERSKQDVRNYAKRQLTWFRKEPDAAWLDGFGGDPEVVERLLGHIG